MRFSANSVWVNKFFDHICEVMNGQRHSMNLVTMVYGKWRIV